MTNLDSALEEFESNDISKAMTDYELKVISSHRNKDFDLKKFTELTKRDLTYKFKDSNYLQIALFQIHRAYQNFAERYNLK